MLKATHFSNVPSTRQTTPTTTAFKMNCSSLLKMELIASLHSWQKIKANIMCNKRFNVSTAAQSKKIKRLFKPLFYHDTSFNCKTPCTTNVYTTKHVQSTPSPVENMIYLVLMFDKTLEVGHSTFSIDGQTFVTRLGGSVSSGRTLLWILLSLFGAVQVISFSCTGSSFTTLVSDRVAQVVVSWVAANEDFFFFNF